MAFPHNSAVKLIGVAGAETFEVSLRPLAVTREAILGLAHSGIQPGSDKLKGINSAPHIK